MLRAVSLLAIFAVPVAAQAARPLVSLAAEDVALLAAQPLADDVALIESDRDGAEKQTSLFVFIAAPPEVVRALIATPGEYKNWIPNLSRSTAEPQADGTIKQAWRMELPVSSFDGVNVFEIRPDAILIHAIDSNDEATYRYEVHASGGGTLLLQYGYTDVKHSNAFVRAFVRRQPMMEHGLALSAQLMFVSAMRAEAQRRAGAIATVSRRGGLGPALLEHLQSRGQVAVMGRDRLVQVMDRVYAPKTAVSDAIANVAAYEKFVPGVERSSARGAGEYFLQMATPLVSWATTWQMRALPGGFDGAGVDGDQKGARFRWLISGGASVMVTYTVQEELARSSFVLRQLFRFQPSLEYGIQVALGLVWMRAIRGRAEGWPT